MRLTKILLLCKRVCEFGLGMGLSLGFLKIIIKKNINLVHILYLIHIYILNQDHFFIQDGIFT